MKYIYIHKQKSGKKHTEMLNDFSPEGGKLFSYFSTSLFSKFPGLSMYCFYKREKCLRIDWQSYPLPYLLPGAPGKEDEPKGNISEELMEAFTNTGATFLKFLLDFKICYFMSF